MKIGKNNIKVPALPKFTAEQTEPLVKVFEEVVAMQGHGSDVIAYDEEISDLISKEFFALTVCTLPGHVLTAKLTALRKRGLLPKAIKKPKDGSFGDIDEAIS